MNKRIKKKLYQKFNNNNLSARRSCVYCVNWGLSCANGHPNIYPGDKSDYLIFCKERFEACNFFAKQLKKEGFSLSGWILSEIPAEHIYAFYNDKTDKDITIIYDTEKSCYTINSSDTFWVYSTKNNLYRHNTVKEALNAPWQHWNHVLDCAMSKREK